MELKKKKSGVTIATISTHDSDVIARAAATVILAELAGRPENEKDEDEMIKDIREYAREAGVPPWVFASRFVGDMANKLLEHNGFEVRSLLTTSAREAADFLRGEEAAQKPLGKVGRA